MNKPHSTHINIVIPKALQKNNLSFVKVGRRSKAAIESGWNKTANYKFNDPELLQHLKNGNNYGLMGGVGNIVIIDCDTKEITRAVKEGLPPTLTSKTPHGHHFIFECEELKSPIRLYNKDHINVGDVQSIGKYVVAPNSISSSGKKYKIVNDIPITKIPVEQLRLTLNEWIVKPKFPNHETELKKSGMTSDILPIEKVIDLSLLEQKHNGSYQGSHPIHGSSGGTNFSVNVDLGLWHCFRCNSGGNAFTWIAVKHGIIKCEEAIKGSLRGNKFLQVLNIAQEKYGIKVESDQVPIILNDIELKENVLMSLAIHKQDDASELIVNRILHDHSIFTMKSTEYPEMWIYKNGIMIPQAIPEINEIVSKYTSKAFQQNFSNRVSDKIRTRTYIEPQEFFEDTPPLNLIAVKNGILNMETRELLPFTQKYKFFSKIPITYDKNAKCPAIKKHLKTVLRNEEDVQVISELFGFLLLRDYTYEKAFMFTGGGRNGKGKTIDLMKRFLGINNITAITIQNLERDQWAQGHLHNKLANLAGDLSPDALKGTGVFKNLTGRDNISADRKYKSKLTFINYAKLVFAANELPITYDLTEAFFSRWIILEFPFKFVDQTDFDNASKSEKKLIRPKNDKILDQLSTDEELSGLLNLALDGLSSLRENKTFSYGKSQEEVRKLWLRRSSSVLGFMMDNMQEAYDGKITKESFRALYGQYCRKYKLPGATDKVIKHILSVNYGVGEEYIRDALGKGRTRVWIGIKEKGLSSPEELNKKIDEIRQEVLKN